MGDLAILSPQIAKQSKTKKNITQKPKSRGIKRKSYLDDGEDDILKFSPKKKMKISPSKIKTKKKQKLNDGDGFKLSIACDSESDQNNDLDSIYSIKSISKSTSLSNEFYSNDILSDLRAPSPPPIIKKNDK